MDNYLFGICYKCPVCDKTKWTLFQILSGLQKLCALIGYVFDVLLLCNNQLMLRTAKLFLPVVSSWSKKSCF